jgi:hypothetical protein
MKFDYIDPLNLRTVWDRIKSGLTVVRERTGETWSQEDVYCAIKTNQAQLFIIDDGFLVLQSIKDQWTNEPVLHIWITYHSTLDDVTEEFHSNLRKLADNIGSKVIRFTSPRRWERKSGAKLVSHNYEIRIAP